MSRQANYALVKMAVALMVVAGLIVGNSHGQPIPGLFNTGVDDDGFPLLDDEIDTHYELIEPSHIVGDAIVATSEGGFPIGPWLDDNDLSAWITPSEDTNGPGDFEMVPSYFYRTTFDLAGLDAANAQITGQWSTDNRGMDIVLNDVSTGIENAVQFAGFSSFVLSGQQGHPFVEGLNTLDFVVNNGAGEANVDGPTGLRVEMTGEILPPPPPGSAPIVTLFNTGVDDDGAPLAAGSPDPHWNILESSDPVFTAPGPAVTQAAHPAWSSPGKIANWISVVDQGTTDIAPGTYVFETEFDLTGMDPDTAEISGNFLADNSITDVLLNEDSAFISGGGFGTSTPFTIDEGFVDGVNTLTFLLANAPQPEPPVENPGGLLVTLAGTAIAVEPMLQAGDADQDWDFDQLDLVRVQIAAKYLTGQPATWGEGDWNGAPGGSPGNPPSGDGVFNQRDIIAALGPAHYLTGPYAAVRSGGKQDDEQTSVVYDPSTGRLAVDAPASTELTSINIDSAAGIFTGGAAANLGGSFDNDADNNIFKATFGGSFGSISFGNVAPAGLSEEFLLGDLTIVGSLAGGGDLGAVDLVYVPEPSAMVLMGLGLVVALLTGGPSVAARNQAATAAARFHVS